MTAYSQYAAQCIPRYALSNCVETFAQMCFQIALTYFPWHVVFAELAFFPACFGREVASFHFNLIFFSKESTIF